jgi:hypothetical protein
MSWRTQANMADWRPGRGLHGERQPGAEGECSTRIGLALRGALFFPLHGFFVGSLFPPSPLNVRGLQNAYGDIGILARSFSGGFLFPRLGGRNGSEFQAQLAGRPEAVDVPGRDYGSRGRRRRHAV